MSISGSYNSSHNNHNMNNMSTHSFFDLKKQASFYIKEKIKTARLALTDVTPVQLMTEEATNANPRAPDTRTLGLISRAAFEVDDYWRIVDILHSKLSKFDRNNWRASYNALIVLEHLMTHGPERVAEEFQTDKFIIDNMRIFQHVDEKGFNWGLAVRKKSERMLKLLENGPLLKEERAHARKLTREIKGFGSFAGRSAPTLEEPTISTTFGRSHSQYNEHGNQDCISETKSCDHPILMQLGNDVKVGKSDSVKRFLKENLAPENDVTRKGDLHVWSDDDAEENMLLNGRSLKDQNIFVSIEEESHPFHDIDRHSRMSLLAAAEEV